MKKLGLCFAAGILFLASAGDFGFGVSGAGAQSMRGQKGAQNIKLGRVRVAISAKTKEIARAAFERVQAGNYDKVYETQEHGTCTFAAIPSGKVMAAAIRGGIPYHWGIAGIQTTGLMNTGRTDWPNVTVTATIHVKEVYSSGVGIMVSLVAESGFPALDSWYDQSISAPGTYVITSHPISVPPDRPFCGFAAVGSAVFDIPGDLSGISAVIRSIKINL